MVLQAIRNIRGEGSEVKIHTFQIHKHQKTLKLYLIQYIHRDLILMIIFGFYFKIIEANIRKRTLTKTTSCYNMQFKNREKKVEHLHHKSTKFSLMVPYCCKPKEEQMLMSITHSTQYKKHKSHKKKKKSHCYFVA
jgi:hypothetical protein